MKESEKEFLMSRLEEIAKNVSRTPVYCGVKVRALEGLEDLIERVENDDLKEPPPEPEKPMDDFSFEMLKGLRGLTPEGTDGRKSLEKNIRHQERLRKKAAAQKV